MIHRSLVLLLIAALGCSATDATGAGRTKYTGGFAGPRTVTSTSVSADGVGSSTCTFTTTVAGTMTVELSADGTAEENVTATQTQVGAAVGHRSGPTGGTVDCLPLATVSLSFSGPATSSASGINATAQSPGPNVTNSLAFTGALSGGVITGTVTISSSGSITNSTSTTTTQGSGSFSVTLK